MDPQQRILLELSHEVLVDGIEKQACGVYVGIYPPEYRSVVESSQLQLSPYHATGATSSAAAGRISFSYGLKVHSHGGELCPHR